MANITIDQDNFSVVSFLDPPLICHMNAAVADRQGVLFYVNTSNRAVTADASGAGSMGNLIGIATTKEKMSAGNESVSLMRRGILFLGEDALDSQAYGAKIYASDDAGLLADAAGTVSRVIGHVIGYERSDGSIDKCLFVDTMAF